MSAKIMQDLALKLSADTAELKKGVKEANTSLKSIQTNTKDIGRKVTASFGSIAAAIGVAVAAFKAVEGIIRSTQTTGDALDQTLGATKNSMDFLAISIASADFSGLIEGLNRAAEAGEEYVIILDEIADRQRALDWRISEDDVRLAEIRVQLRRKDLSAAEKQALAAEGMLITERQINDTVNLRQMAYDAIYNKIQKTLGMTDDEMSKIENWLKNYGNMGEVGLGKVQAVLEAQSKLSELKKTYNEELTAYARAKQYDASLTKEEFGFTVTQQMIDDQEYLSAWLADGLKGVESAALEAINKFGPKISDALRDALAEAAIEFNRAQVQIINKQSTFSRYLEGDTESRRETVEVTKSLGELEEERLKVQEDFNRAIQENDVVAFQAAEKRLTELDAEIEAVKELQRLIDKLRGNGDNNPPQRMTSKTSKGLPVEGGSLQDVSDPIEEANEDLADFGSYLQDAINDAWTLVSVAEILGKALGQSFTDAGGAVKGLIGDLMQLAKSILMVAIAEHIKNSTSGVMNWLTAGGWGAATAVAGVAAITAAWNSIKLADGGLAYGETLATVGEYGGARSNPEVIAPLDKLKGIIADSMGGMNGEVRFEIEGDKLVGILSKYNSKKIYF